MKKIVCLVLSLVLCLSMLCAVAEEGSASPAPEITAEILSEVPAGFAPVLAAPTEEDIATIAAPETIAALAAAFGEHGDKTVAVYEVFVMSFEGYVEGMGDVTIVFTFPTVFTAGQKVVVALQLDEGFVGYEGIVGDGTVTVTLPESTVAQLAAAPRLCAVMATVAE